MYSGVHFLIGLQKEGGIFTICRTALYVEWKHEANGTVSFSSDDLIITCWRVEGWRGVVIMELGWMVTGSVKSGLSPWLSRWLKSIPIEQSLELFPESCRRSLRWSGGSISLSQLLTGWALTPSALLPIRSDEVMSVVFSRQVWMSSLCQAEVWCVFAWVHCQGSNIGMEDRQSWAGLSSG